MAHKSGLEGQLDSVGKATFKNCYDVFAQNYNKEDKHKIADAVIKEGLLRTGRRYADSSVTTKVNAGSAIFLQGQQKEALDLCKSSRCK